MTLRMHPNEPSAASTLTAIAMYVALTCAIFGDPFEPIWFVTYARDGLAAPGWMLLVAASVAISFTVSFLRPPKRMDRFWRLPLFTMLSIALSTASVGIYAETLRTAAIARFQPDVEEHQSFFRSLRLDADDYHFILHGAALKDCIPYGWSYRHMEYYRIPPSAAPNVLPGKWLEICPVIRERWKALFPPKADGPT